MAANKPARTRRKRGTKSTKRFLTVDDMKVIRYDESVYRSKAKRGEATLSNTGSIIPCGCGAVGCAIHTSWTLK